MQHQISTITGSASKYTNIELTNIWKNLKSKNT